MYISNVFFSSLGTNTSPTTSSTVKAATDMPKEQGANSTPEKPPVEEVPKPPLRERIRTAPRRSKEYISMFLPLSNQCALCLL